jgi:hypothetical protein
MPEPGGLTLDTATAAIRVLAAAVPVAGFGPTGITLANGDAVRTFDAVVALAGAAFG